MALVPTPDEISGIIISRDPTDRWLPKYEEYQGNREKLFEAIPEFLLKRIIEFMGNSFTEKNKNDLSSTILQNTYWTHLHKCFTGDPKNGFTEFKPANATKCADCWLTKELDLIIKNNKPEFVLTLGTHARDWVKEWRESRETKIEIINLIHPSSQNNMIWTRSAERIIKETEESIRELMKYVK